MEYIYEVHDIVPRALCEEIIEKFEMTLIKKQVVSELVKR